VTLLRFDHDIDRWFVDWDGDELDHDPSNGRFWVDADGDLVADHLAALSTFEATLVALVDAAGLEYDEPSRVDVCENGRSGCDFGRCAGCGNPMEAHSVERGGHGR
jgi:hypothetical protein